MKEYNADPKGLAWGDILSLFIETNILVYGLIHLKNIELYTINV